MSSLRDDPLAAHLAAQSPETDALRLSLAEIEALVGAPLPASAYGSTWWGSTALSKQARPWLATGWRVAGTHLRATPAAVTFARVGRDPAR